MLVRRVPLNKEERLSARYQERIERASSISLVLLLLSVVLLAASFVLAQVFSYMDRTDPLSDVSETKAGAIGIYVSIVGFVVCLISFAYLLGALGSSRASRVSARLSRHKRALVTLVAGLFLAGLYLFTWLFVWPAWY